MNSSSTPSAATATPTNPAPQGRGRPQIMTPEIATAMVKFIRVYGLSDSHAGVLAGVSSSSVSRWKQASEDFSDLLEKARAEFELERVLALLEATRPDGSPDWRAQAWLLRNSSREGGWGKAAKPMQEAPPQKPENLPKNTAAPERAPEPAPAPATPERCDRESNLPHAAGRVPAGEGETPTLPGTPAATPISSYVGGAVHKSSPLSKNRRTLPTFIS